MSYIKINKKKYKFIYSWSDMILRKYCELASIPIPSGYEAYIRADGKYSLDDKESRDEYTKIVLSLTDDQKNIEFPAYYRKVCLCLSDVPDELLPEDKMFNLYDLYFKPFVCSLIYHAPVISFMGRLKDFEPMKIKSFRIGCSRYYLPKSVLIGDDEISLYQEPVITYYEASEIFNGLIISKDEINRLGLFMAIYCRKKNEEYDEKKALERMDIMMTLPMSIVWSVFFYTVRHMPGFIPIIKLFGSLPHQIYEIADLLRESKNMVS